MLPRQLQTAALCCVYLAAKLHETYPLTMTHIRRYFSEICVADDIRRAELNILCYLGWDIDGFTACGFIRAVLLLVPSGVAASLSTTAEAYFRLAILGACCVCVLTGCSACHCDIRT